MMPEWVSVMEELSFSGAGLCTAAILRAEGPASAHGHARLAAGPTLTHEARTELGGFQWTARHQHCERRILRWCEWHWPGRKRRHHGGHWQCCWGSIGQPFAGYGASSRGQRRRRAGCRGLGREWCRWVGSDPGWCISLGKHRGLPVLGIWSQRPGCRRRHHGNHDCKWRSERSIGFADRRPGWRSERRPEYHGQRCSSRHGRIDIRGGRWKCWRKWEHSFDSWRL